MIQQYFEKIGLKNADNRDEFFKEIDAKYKINLTQNLDMATSLRKDKTNGKLYSTKNESLERSIDFAGYYFDLYRQCLSWLKYTQDLNGKKILDLGCDNGIATCFIAMSYPEAKIIGVDKSKKGITCAKELAEKLELKNVEFEMTDAKKLDKFFKEDKFDVVISNRSILEIVSLPKLKSYWSISEVEKSTIITNSVVKFLKSIEKIMTSDAKLIAFERLETLEEIFNFEKSMRASGLYIDTDKMVKIQFNELGDCVQMPIMTFDKQKREEMNFAQCIDMYTKLPVINKSTTVEDDFAIELEFNKIEDKSLVFGSQIDYKNGAGSERREVWQAGDKFISYKYSNIGRRLLSTEGINKDAAIKEIKNMTGFIERMGNKITEYTTLEQRDAIK